jgi:hypothetical protein
VDHLRRPLNSNVPEGPLSHTPNYRFGSIVSLEQLKLGAEKRALNFRFLEAAIRH